MIVLFFAQRPFLKIRGSFVGEHLLLNKVGLVDLAPSVVAGMKGKSVVLCNVVLLDTYIVTIYLSTSS